MYKAVSLMYPCHMDSEKGLSIFKIRILSSIKDGNRKQEPDLHWSLSVCTPHMKLVPALGNSNDEFLLL